MSRHLETRRSVTRGDGIQLMSATRGTRSATATIPDRASDAQYYSTISPSPLFNKKRLRESSELRSNSPVHITSSHLKDHKKIKLQEHAKLPAESGNSKLAIETTCMTTLDPTSSSSLSKPAKKASPLVERMRVLEARYARVTQALLESESKHTEHQIRRIKKGICPELMEMIAPLEAARQDRTAIAEKKLALQKSQVDREWRAARTCAQYDFVKARADLRATLRQTFSRQVFDVSREYRDMSTESLGLLPDGRIQSHYRTRERLIGEPLGASLTEKDEDLILMDIAVVREAPGEDPKVLAVAPILDALTTPRKKSGTKRPVLTKNSEKNIARKKSQATKKVGMPKRDGDDVQMAKLNIEPASRSSNLPSISSLIEAVPNPGCLVAPTMKSVAKPTTPHIYSSGHSQESSQTQFANDLSKRVVSDSILSPNNLRRRSPAPGITDGLLYDSSMAPYSTSGLDNRNGQTSYNTSASVGHSGSIQQYNPWPPRDHINNIGQGSFPTAPLNNGPQAYETKRDSRQISSGPRSHLSTSDLHSPRISDHANRLNMHETQSPSGSSSLPNQNGSGTSPIPLQQTSHSGFLHPFRRTETLPDRPAHNPTSLAGHGLSFKSQESGMDSRSGTPTESSKKQKGILWGGLRR